MHENKQINDDNLLCIIKFLWPTGNHPFLCGCHKMECSHMERPLGQGHATPLDQLVQSEKTRSNNINSYIYLVLASFLRQ